MANNSAIRWKAALSRQCNLQELCSVQRLMSLRVISAHQTVPSHMSDMQKHARKATMSSWQHQWDSLERGRCDHHLMPYVGLWMDRRHVEVDFSMTHGHGCFM
ncbi:uncharacterized protein LOC129742844 [Uranotaenia lowii]|uniref:uncharacterized protein LOC129742844 n=1 Tax=Uranotaenia lowii TaxID=190385 RepID=UPI00247A774C|nr:uncharacterized protein LOC129742844 [Uranotaenia lowii]